MRYIMPIVIILVAAVFWVYFKNTVSAAGIRISPSEAKKKLENDKRVILLDVRTSDEHKESHIKGSILIPLDVLSEEAYKKLPDKDAEIVVYCRSGGRSTTACDILIKQGYTHVFNLGGITGWPYEKVYGNKD